MKKRLSILMALVFVFTLALPFLAACGGKDEDAVDVASIRVVDPQTLYFVGDTIDYDALIIEITYLNGSKKEKPLGQLKSATYTEANLLQEGETYYTITFGGQTVQVTITVSSSNLPIDVVMRIVAPNAYTTYRTASATRKESEVEARGDFRITGEVYEVGNVNQFIFRPLVMGLNLEYGVPVTMPNAKTTVMVSVKDSAAGGYNSLTESEAKEYVEIGENTYQFTEAAAGKYFMLEISLDGSVYNVENLDADERTLTVEFVVVGGGYNVYDQMGLSVMADLEKTAWAEIWKCDVTVGETAVTLTAREDSLKLEADDKPLCEYVGNVKTVILHNTVTLDADGMPSKYFWTTSSDMYAETRSSLAAFPEAQAGLVGSLRDGANQEGTEAWNYMRVIDVTNDEGYATELGYEVTNNKAIFSTSKVSVSGNYQSILSPARGNRTTLGRSLEVYADTDNEPQDLASPWSHWAIFQMYQSQLEGTEKVEFVIKNVALQGNNPQENSSGFVATGLLLVDNYCPDITLRNVNASQFFNNVNGEDFGPFLYGADGKASAEGTEIKPQVELDSCKFYNAYSNMMQVFSNDVTVTNCELIGSGGPLFILNSGDKLAYDEDGTAVTDDAAGPALTVDSKSVLQAYATGAESWYTMYGTQPLFGAIEDIFEPLINELGKTIYFRNPGIVGSGNDYLNIISVMIPSATKIIDGGNPEDYTGMIDTQGTFTQLGSEGEIVNDFAMHNDFVKLVKGNAVTYETNHPGEGLGKRFAPILQAGGNMVGIQNMDPTAPDYLLSSNLTDILLGRNITVAEEAARWKGNTSNLLCVYISAGVIDVGNRFSPYFAFIVEMGNKA